MRTISNLTKIFLLSTLCSATSYAQGDQQEAPRDGTDIIEIHLKEEVTANYQEKRSAWTVRFSPFSTEKMNPSSYVSPADQKTYTQIYNTNQIQMSSVSLGVQYNSMIGGLYLDGIYGKGSVTSITGIGTLSADKMGLDFGLFMDSLFSNPWVSPFIGGQVISFNWKEIDTNIDTSGKTAYTTAIVAGISIHLNRIDERSAVDSYSDYGLRNTFLDIYGIQYSSTAGAPGDPDFKTDFNIGAGLRLEF